MERENWIDWGKTFLIYLVVVGHSCLISGTTDVFITSFHMPAFLCFLDSCIKDNKR